MVAVRLLARPTRSPRPRPLPLLLRPLGSRPSSAGASPTADPIGHCRTLTRTHDPDAFLASYFYPAGRPREAFWAYRALNLELATIAEGATNAQLGSIKLRWWKDVVRDISAGKAPPAHPIAQALSLTATEQTADLTAYYWAQLIEARMDLLHKPPPSTVVQLLQSLALSHTPLHYLSLALLTSPPSSASSSSPSSSSSSSSRMVAARNPPPEAMQAIQHLSLASGLVNLLAQLPHYARSARLPALPVDLRVAHGVTPDEVVRLGGAAPGLPEAVFEVATRANDELVTSRAEWGQGGRPPRELLPAFLPGVAVQSYLSRLERAAFDPFDPALQRRHWRTPLDVWWAVKRGRY